ncbi:MAG: T9SS type A sorting domain-containing protein, partial [Cyclobacteriaceae bacterium]|nr:T9SS type A sorting domain-containing protein [Cyclobacteriaceae bacterium]
ATSEVLKYDFDGNLITAIPNNNVGGQLYLGAKSSTQGWEAPSQGFGGSSLTQGDITVYPNPVIDYMEVVHANGNIPIENISILLYDNSGVPVTSSISSLPSQVNHGLVVDMTALQSGFYFLHVNDNITTEVFRIQKN